MKQETAAACALFAITVSACGGETGNTKSATPLTGAALGEKLFNQCAVCHNAAAPDTPAGAMRQVGPNLFGVVDRPFAAIEGFDYSPAMRKAGLIWDEATLDAFLTKPQDIVRNNRMSYAGEPDADRRRAIIEYLKTLR